MEIEFFGKGMIKITTKNAVLYFDPHKKPSFAKNKRNIVLLTDIDTKYESKDEEFVISTAGEYEIANIGIKSVLIQRHIDGADEPKRSIAHILHTADGSAAVLGNIDPKISESVLEEIGIVDILVIPVGGKGLTLDAIAAAKIVKEVEPKVVIPKHYDDGSEYEVPQDTAETFIKELSLEATQTDKYKFSAATASESMQLVVLDVQ